VCGEEEDALLDLSSWSAWAIGSDEDGAAGGFGDQLAHGLRATARGGATDGVNADLLHEVGEDGAVLVLADEGDDAALLEEGADLGGAENGKEDLIVPEAVDELLFDIEVGDIGAGGLAGDFNADRATEPAEGLGDQPGGEADEISVANFHGECPVGIKRRVAVVCRTSAISRGGIVEKTGNPPSANRGVRMVIAGEEWRGVFSGGDRLTNFGESERLRPP